MKPTRTLPIYVYFYMLNLNQVDAYGHLKLVTKAIQLAYLTNTVSNIQSGVLRLERILKDFNFSLHS